MLHLVRLVVYLLVRVPLLIQLALAGLLFLAGVHSDAQRAAEIAQKQALLAAPPPELIPIESFSRKGVGERVVEARVLANWASAYNSRLTTEKNGVERHDASYVVLMDKAAGITGHRVAAIIAVPGFQHDKFVDWLNAQLVSTDMSQPLMMAEGLAVPLDKAPGWSRIKEQLPKDHLTVDDQSFALVPFLDGREAGLAVPAAGESHRAPEQDLALVLLSACALRFLWRLRTGRAFEDLASLWAALPLLIGGAALAWILDYPRLALGLAAPVLGAAALLAWRWHRGVPTPDVGEAAPAPRKSWEPLPPMAHSGPVAAPAPKASFGSPSRSAPRLSGPVETAPTAVQWVTELVARGGIRAWAPFLCAVVMLALTALAGRLQGVDLPSIPAPPGVVTALTQALPPGGIQTLGPERVQPGAPAPKAEAAPAAKAAGGLGLDGPKVTGLFLILGLIARGIWQWWNARPAQSRADPWADLGRRLR